MIVFFNFYLNSIRLIKNLQTKIDILGARIIRGKMHRAIK
ncbi:hypothetical protein SAMN06265375_103117 [Muriicola jejuensis]|nr:hypothetical protein SAMN06265375_103117 [Muriicola jejuensis]